MNSLNRDLLGLTVLVAGNRPLRERLLKVDGGGGSTAAGAGCQLSGTWICDGKRATPNANWVERIWEPTAPKARCRQ